VTVLRCGEQVHKHVRPMSNFLRIITPKTRFRVRIKGLMLGLAVKVNSCGQLLG